MAALHSAVYVCNDFLAAPMRDAFTNIRFSLQAVLIASFRVQTWERKKLLVEIIHPEYVNVKSSSAKNFDGIMPVFVIHLLV